MFFETSYFFSLTIILLIKYSVFSVNSYIGIILIRLIQDKLLLIFDNYFYIGFQYPNESACVSKNRHVNNIITLL